VAEGEELGSNLLRPRATSVACRAGPWRHLADAGTDGERGAGGAAGFVGRHRHRPATAALGPQLQVELVEFGIDHRGLEGDQPAPVP